MSRPKKYVSQLDYDTGQDFIEEVVSLAHKVRDLQGQVVKRLGLNHTLGLKLGLVQSRLLEIELLIAESSATFEEEMAQTTSGDH